MTHWLVFSKADFDASRAPRSAGKRPAEQPGLFFVPTPLKAPKNTPAAGRLPGQAAMFGDEDQAAETASRHVPDPPIPELGPQRESEKPWEQFTGSQPDRASPPAQPAPPT